MGPIGWADSDTANLVVCDNGEGHKCVEARRRGKVESDGKDQGFTRPTKSNGGNIAAGDVSKKS